MDDNKVCSVCGRTYPKESEDSVCQSCRKRMNEYALPSLKEKILKHITDNVALFDCQSDCPDEVSINNDLRTPEYCNKCFTNQIQALIKEADYVKLAADQNKPYELLNQESKADWFSAYGIMNVLSAWRGCYESMLRAGWRKIELED